MSDPANSSNPRKRGSRGGRRRGERNKVDRVIDAQAAARMEARLRGGAIVLADGEEVTVEGLTLDLDGGRDRQGLWEQKRKLDSGSAQ